MTVHLDNAMRQHQEELGMAVTDISGATEIGDEGIRKHFKSTEPYQAIFELVWNGFDAKATTVDISIARNQLGGLVEISVLDNGEGIDFLNIKNNFGRFNESEKREDTTQHGSQGRGRLAFHKLAHEAKWYTKSSSGEAIIEVNSNHIKWYDGKVLEPENFHGRVPHNPSGTLVDLQHLHENLPEQELLLGMLSNEFGWFLALNPNKKLLVNGASVAVPVHEIKEDVCAVGEIVFNIKVIRWHEKPSSEKSYTYLLNSSDKQVFRQLSTLNNKPNFYTSVYVKSPWADKFSATKDLFQPGMVGPDSDEWKALGKHLNVLTRRVYDDFLREFVDAEITKYEEDGIFPTYAGLDKAEADWRLENTKSIVRSIYTADPTVFNSLKKKQKKILVRLLDRMAVSDQNDSLFDVLNGVLDLDQGSVETLASQLKRTTLENIISTIALLQKRQDAVNQLRELMNVHYATVSETPDLQKIIENNTWLFGHQYEILGAEETTFTRIAKGLRDALKDINDIEDDDVEGDATVQGANRQPDLFLARKVMATNSFGHRYYRCIIVEIKRPSISLNVKHLRQLEDYAKIIKKHPEFTSGQLHFELILVGRKISSDDTEIAGRLKNQLHRGEVGLEYADEQMKRYVLNWYTLLDGFELTNGTLLEKLKLQRDSLSELSKNDLVEGLQDLTSKRST